MKKTLYVKTVLVLTIVLFLNMNIACAPSDSYHPTYAQSKSSLRIVSYNILADSIGFDGLSATTRTTLFADTVKAISPHVLCLQEVSNNWYNEINKLSGSFKFTAPIRNRLCMCMTPILYDTQKLTLINSGIESYSCSLDSRIRCISWAYFSQKDTNKRFVVLNTHLSLYDKNQYLPLLQARQLLDFVNTISHKYDCPVFVAGDFNTKQRGEGIFDSATYEYISLMLTDTRLAASNVFSGTEKSADTPTNDYIFFTGNASIKGYTMLSLPALKTLSDHFPIFADIILS